MKSIILVVAVAAFEFAFFASIATPPVASADAASAVEPPGPAAGQLAQRAGSPVPCTSPG